MPQRTTEFQTIVHFVRQQTAANDVTVTESKMLHDVHSDTDREVDIVIDGELDGDPIVTSIEVIEHGRKASITWVEQQIAKHRFLPTNRLVLISRSGFSDAALRAAAAEGGWVDTLVPEIVMQNGQPVVDRLFVDEVSLTPTTCRITVLQPDGTTRVANMTQAPDVSVYDVNGELLGTVYQLGRELLDLPWVAQRFIHNAHNHPEREMLKGFSMGVPIGECRYLMHWEETDEYHLIVVVELTGRFEFRQSELTFEMTRLGSRVFGSGKGQFLGREAVWVRTTDDQGQMLLSLKSLDKSTPASSSSPLPPTMQFPALLGITEPDKWIDDPDSDAGDLLPQ